MDAKHEAATVAALEAATDALLVALGKLPEPDLEAAAAALDARANAIADLASSDPAARSPELTARLVAVLERDARATTHLRNELAVTHARLTELTARRNAAAAYGGGASGRGRTRPRDDAGENQ